MNTTLTKYPVGSKRELWSIAFPLMLCSLSFLAMLFVDRLMLARYSTAALNAAVHTMTLGWAILGGWMVLANIAEVFVAQYNGAGRRDKLGEPVWQMIWLSCTSILCFLPLAIWGTPLIFGGEERQMHREYFFWMMIFGPSIPLHSALASFFIGQGQTTLVTLLAVGANIINVCLDVTLIFGVPGWIPSLGVTGAAIATSGSCFFEVAVLAYYFLKKHNRMECGTGNCQIQLDSLWQCIKIGMPNALFVAIEVLGWATFYIMMAMVGERYITVAGICQSIAIFLSFFSEGMNKGIATVVGNLIGAKRYALIPQVVRSGILLHLLFSLSVLVVLTGMTDLLMTQFLPEAEAAYLADLRPTIWTGLLCVTGYLLFEGLRLVFGGVLTAAGDTIFLLIGGSLSVWFLLVIPSYLLLMKVGISVETAIALWVIYAFGTSLLYYWRYASNKWQAFSLLKPAPVMEVQSSQQEVQEFGR